MEKKKRFVNSLYNNTMLFVIGCFLGCVFETILCYFQRGHFESRSGLIYGPLNPVYGFGFVFVCSLLKKEKKTYMIFIKGFFYGGLVEYLCSWFQETFLHTTSWNYSDYYLNFDGRTSVYHMIFWGLGALIVMKNIYPYVIKLIQKVKEKYRLVISIVIIVLLVIDIFISTIACIRYKERLDNKKASNSIEVFLDKHYPNKRLIKIYPNVKDAKTQVKLKNMK